MDHFKEKYTQGPNVNFFGLFFPQIDLGCHVLESPAESVFSILLVHTGSEVC
jgi:hypothetical protein